MLVIKHTFETGTVIYGTSRNDGNKQVIAKHGFRLSRDLPAHPEHGTPYWYLPSTRRRRARVHDIMKCVSDLRETADAVLTEIDNVTLPTTPFADLEQERYDRAQARADRYQDRAESASSKGTAMIEQSEEERRRIPPGQPHLIGHHSYNRTRRAEERRNAREDRGRELLKRGRRWGDRAEAAAQYQAGREALATTIHRVERLEAEVRRHKRDLKGRLEHFQVEGTTDSPEICGQPLDAYIQALRPGSHLIRIDEDYHLAKIRIPPIEADRAILPSLITMLEEEITYWRTHIQTLQAETGIKIWGPGDFKPGDFARSGKRWYEIIRVNPKTLTVVSPIHDIDHAALTQAMARHVNSGRLWTSKLSYKNTSGQMDTQQARTRFPEAFPPTSPPSPENDEEGS